jgi:ABC-type multidrug transport system ATPase subunit
MNDSILSYSEPTSGLDSTSAVALMDVLRELALQGKTIITSIHQPSSQIFQSFDQLILLADGKTIFMVNSIEDVFNRKVFYLYIG